MMPGEQCDVNLCLYKELSSDFMGSIVLQWNEMELECGAIKVEKKLAAD